MMKEGSEEQRLKYLEFVQAAVLHLVLCAASVYAYAKDNSGPLKPGVQRVEGTVRTVVGPVYNKFHDVPFALPKLVDRKVFFCLRIWCIICFSDYHSKYICFLNWI